MSRLLLLAALLLPIGALAVLVPPPSAADEEPVTDRADPAARARHAWAHTCRRCHADPDPAHATDRAFLRQITETT